MKELLLKQASEYKDRHDAFVNDVLEATASSLTGAGIGEKMVKAAFDAVSSGDVKAYLDEVKESALSNCGEENLEKVASSIDERIAIIEKIASSESIKALESSEFLEISDIFEKVASHIDELETKLVDSTERVSYLEKQAEEAEAQSKFGARLEKLASAGFTQADISKLSKLDDPALLEKLASSNLNAPADLGSGGQMSTGGMDPLTEFLCS